MSFSAAEENFHVGARDGIDARVYWPGVGEVPVAELVLRRLLPAAHEGLDRLGRRPRRARSAARHHRAPLRDRSATAPRGRAAVFHRLYDDAASSATQALRQMTVRYRELMHANAPVHDWPLE